jgi:hypothetical protein
VPVFATGLNSARLCRVSGEERGIETDLPVAFLSIITRRGVSNMAIQKIGKLSLHNGGGFVARGQVAYIDDNGEKHLSGSTGDILLGQTNDIDPGALGVPNGSIISLYVFVVWGTDNEARQSFIFEQGSKVKANYTITGTTLSNTLGLINVD